MVFLVTSCSYRDFRPVINTVYALIEGKQLYEDDKHQEELLWFAGEKKCLQFPKVKIKRVSSQFPDAGLFTYRDINSWSMIILNTFHSRPAHLDQLHFDLWVEGINVFCDAGTYSYASELGKTLVKNESHNTAIVEGKSQMNVHGPFMIYNWTERKLRRVDNTFFDGTAVSKNGYMHTRRIEKKSYGYEITDTVDTDFSIMFHTPCEVTLKNKTVLLSSSGKVLCNIISDGAISLFKSKRSIYYLKEEEITCLCINGKANQSNKTTLIIKENWIDD